MAVVRWKLYDGVESYTFAFNPNRMSSPHPDAPVEGAGSTRDVGLLLATRVAPQLMRVSGVLLEQSQYEAFVRWHRRHQRLTLIDHLGRSMTVFLMSFIPETVRSKNFWKHQYELSFFVLNVISGEGGLTFPDAPDNTPSPFPTPEPEPEPEPLPDTEPAEPEPPPEEPVATTPLPDVSLRPSSTTTGPRASMTASGTITTTADGQKISRKDVTGQIIIKHRNVTVTDCRVRYGGPGYAIHVMPTDAAGNPIAGIKIHYTDVVLTRSSGAKACIGGLTNNAVESYQGAKIMVRYCDLSGYGDGIHASHWALYYGNYIHTRPATGQLVAGIRGLGVSKWTAHTNWINQAYAVGQQAAILIEPFTGTQNVAVNDVRIYRNWLNGGIYTVHSKPYRTTHAVPAGTAVTGRVHDNQFYRNYSYGVYMREGGLLASATGIDGGVWQDTQVKVPHGRIATSPDPAPSPEPSPTPPPPTTTVEPPTELYVSPTSDGGIVTAQPSTTTGVVRHDFVAGTQKKSILAGEPLRWQVFNLQSGSHTVSVVAVHSDGSKSATVSYTWTVPTGTNTGVLEYRVVTTSHDAAGFHGIQDQAIAGDKAVRVVGGLGYANGTFYWKEGLTDLRFDAGSGFKQHDLAAQGTLVRYGSYSSTSWSIVSGGQKGGTTLTLNTVAGLAVGDLVLCGAKVYYSHKDHYWAHTRKITAINTSTNVITVDLPFHRSRGTAAGWVRKLALARPAVAQGGVFTHAYYKTAQGLPLVSLIGCRGTVWNGLETRYGPGAGVMVCNGYQNRFESLFTHHLRNSPSQNQYGYGVSDGGDRETYFEIEATECRHAYTTNQSKHMNHGAWKALMGYAEAEYNTMIFNVYKTICTGVNSHEPGYGLTYGGVIRDTGTVGRGVSDVNAIAGENNTNDPTGIFWRDRKGRIHPTLGLRLVGINNQGGGRWYSAATVADIANSAKTQGFVAWPPEDAFELGPGKLTVEAANTGDALSIRQPAELSNVELIGPNPTGIAMVSPHGTGDHSWVKSGGSVIVRKMSTPIENAYLLDNSGAVVVTS